MNVLALLAALLPTLPLTGAGIDSLLQNRTACNPRPLPGQSVPGIAPRAGLERPTGTQRVFPHVPSRAIRDDFVCNDDTTGGCRQARPRVGVAADGSFVVGWYGFTAGEADIWFQRFDPDGRQLGGNLAANCDSTMRWQGNPDIAVRGDGSFLLSWEDRWQVGNSDVFARLFGPGGDARGRSFRVSDSGVPGDQMVSGVWTSPSGLTLAAWDDRRHGIGGDIYARFIDTAGLPLDTGFRVNDDGINVGNQYRPVVAGDDSGRFVVVWMDGRTGRWNVFGQRFGADRARLGPNFQVTTSTHWQWAPAVGVAPGGRFLVCWEDSSRGQWDICARVYDAQGRPVSDPFRVNDDPGVASQFDCFAAGNRHDEFLVVWADRRGGYDDIRGQRYQQDGTPLGGNFLVSGSGAAPAGRGAPAATARPDGGYVVAWADGGPGHLDIHARLFARDGTPETPPFRVNTDSASSQQRVSSLDMFADGRVIVAWEDERDGRCDIYSVLLDPNGLPTGANRRLNDDPAGVNPQYYAAAAAGRTRALATWSDGRDDGFHVFGQYLDSLGNPLGGNFRINAPVTGHRWYSFAAMDHNDRAFVVWMDTRDGGYRIYGRRFLNDGRPSGDDFRVSDTDVVQLYATVASNRAGRSLVAWMDYREGSRPNIYCQLHDTCGTRLGACFRVNDDPGDNHQGYPAAAVAEDGGFVVAWQDRRNESYDVYLQWFAEDRTPLDVNVRVNDGPADAYAYSPSCAFDSEGRLVVLFNDEREQTRSPRIYVQRFRTDRTRIGGNRKLNEPNEGPRNHHWTVGRSITVGDSVVAATWTGNRRLQGWDIYARFTDWDLIGIAERYNPDRSAAPEPFRIFPTVSPGGRFTAAGPAGEMRLYDAGGRRRRLVAISPRPTVVDLGDLPAGVYFLAEPYPGQRKLKLAIPDRR